jgi:hypothetical protein
MTWQRERFRSQRPTHRISRFNWQRRYGIFTEVPNSYRTWIKASAGVLPTPPEDLRAPIDFADESRSRGNVSAVSGLGNAAIFFRGTPIARRQRRITQSGSSLSAR